jgi:hypothetical protein
MTDASSVFAGNRSNTKRRFTLQKGIVGAAQGRRSLRRLAWRIETQI